MGRPAARTGLWFGHDVLATLARLAVWALLHQTLLSLLHAEQKLDWSRALVEISSVRAVFGGPKLAPTTHLQPLVNAIPLVLGRRGRPRWRPDRVQTGVMTHKRTAFGCAHKASRLYSPSATRHMVVVWDCIRWDVERTIAWLHQFRRLRIRYERRADIHEAFVSLACSLIAFRFL